MTMIQKFNFDNLVLINQYNYDIKLRFRLLLLYD